MLFLYWRPCSSPIQIAMLVTSGSAENNRFAIRRRFCAMAASKKLVVRAVRSTQAQAIQLQDALEVREEHLDLLAILA